MERVPEIVSLYWLMQSSKTCTAVFAISSCVEDDIANDFGGVSLPNTLGVRYPCAQFERKWQYVFPSKNISRDPRSDKLKRHHADPNGRQKAVRRVFKTAQSNKHVTPHTLRLGFETHLLAGGYDIRAVQDLLGRKYVTMTMIYTHVLNRGGLAVRSPLDSEK